MAVLFYFTTFLSAFLLFALQPLIARAILPWFGGAAGVWNCSQFFFQGVLLLGYLYAHLSSTGGLSRASQEGPGVRQAVFHVALLLLSLAFLPVFPEARWKPSPADDPGLQILVTLTATIGLPYLVLSSTSPLLASWYLRALPGRSPYPLFAGSNLGSFLGLLGYPLILDTLFGVQQQIWLWSAGYLACAGIIAYLSYRQAKIPPAPQADESSRLVDEAPTALSDWLLWLALPMCSSVLLVAVTHYISTEVAAVPLLWVIPLSLYLLSYVAVASSWSLYRRWLFYPLLGLSLYGVEFLLDPGDLSPFLIVIGMWAALLVLFMVCHGELWAHRPEPRRLTHFYLMMSVGGTCGSFLVAYLCPTFLDANYELPLALFLCPVLAAWSYLTGPARGRPRRQLLIHVGLMVPLMLLFASYQISQELKYRGSQLVSVRNFYGTAWVAQVSQPIASRYLYNGRINHGCQYLARERQTVATGYYGASSGAGRVFAWLQKSKPEMKVGIVGLGVGMLASYGRPTDDFRFYELDPKIVALANQCFTYLALGPARPGVVLGDARLSLEREKSELFDLLIVDAFTGDSIPVHLLTQEAFDTYARVLKPDGILLLHLSNLYLDLPPVVAAQAERQGKTALICWDNGGADPLTFPSLWSAVVPHSSSAAGDLERSGFRPPTGRQPILWTDDRNNLFSILKPRS